MLTAEADRRQEWLFPAALGEPAAPEEEIQMRRSREDTVETRRRIVEAAARRFRTHGITSVSVADIMGDVGLTVGGFYRHFPSKEALVAEAIQAATQETGRRFKEQTANLSPQEAFSAMVGTYLSKLHRNNPGVGCPVAALCSDAGREGFPTKEAFTGAIRHLMQGVGGPYLENPETRRQALRTVAAMVGAVVLARATDDETLAEEFLAAVRNTTLEDRAKLNARTA